MMEDVNKAISKKERTRLIILMLLKAQKHKQHKKQNGNKKNRNFEII